MVTDEVIYARGRKDRLASGGCLNFRSDVWILRSTASRSEALVSQLSYTLLFFVSRNAIELSRLY